MNRKDNNSEETLKFDELLATTKAYLIFLLASSLTVFQPIVRAAIRNTFLKCHSSAWTLHWLLSTFRIKSKTLNIAGLSWLEPHLPVKIHLSRLPSLTQPITTHISPSISSVEWNAVLISCPLGCEAPVSSSWYAFLHFVWNPPTFLQTNYYAPGCFPWLSRTEFCAISTCSRSILHVTCPTYSNLPWNAWFLCVTH